MRHMHCIVMVLCFCCKQSFKVPSSYRLQDRKTLESYGGKIVGLYNPPTATLKMKGNTACHDADCQEDRGTASLQVSWTQVLEKKATTRYLAGQMDTSNAVLGCPDFFDFLDGCMRSSSTRGMLNCIVKLSAVQDYEWLWLEQIFL